MLRPRSGVTGLVSVELCGTRFAFPLLLASHLAPFSSYGLPLLPHASPWRWHLRRRPARYARTGLTPPPRLARRLAEKAAARPGRARRPQRSSFSGGFFSQNGTGRIRGPCQLNLLVEVDHERVRLEVVTYLVSAVTAMSETARQQLKSMGRLN